MGRGLHTVPLCALLRHASVGSREQVQRPLPPPRRPSGSGGAEGRALGSPAGEGGGGGGSVGGPLVPWRCLLTAGGGGRHGSPGPGGQPSAWGVAPFPRPPLPRAGSSCRPSLGPLIPRPLLRGAGRPGAAVRVSGQWLAGGGAAGSLQCSLSPYSLPREAARSHASCRTMGGAWVGGPGSSPHSRASALWAIPCAAAWVLSMGGVAPHTTPVRAQPASLGTICAASRCAGVGPLVLRGPHVSRRLGRGGGSHSGSPLGRGGAIPPASGVGGRGPRGWRAGGGAGGGGVAPRPPCSRSGRRPAVLLSGPLRVAGALPSGARVRSGLKCRPRVGGGEGRPVDRSPGGPS